MSKHIRNIADICEEIRKVAIEAVSLAESGESVLEKLGRIEDLIAEAVDTEYPDG